MRSIGLGPSATSKPSGRALGTAWALSVLIALALLVRLAIKDRVPYVAAFYYGTPLPLLTLMCIGCSAAWLRARRFAPAAAAFVGVLMIGGWWFSEPLFGQWRSAPSVANWYYRPRFKAVAWNVYEGYMGWTGPTEYLKQANADLVLLNEADDHRPDVRPMWVELFPEYHVSRPFHGLLIMSRYPIEELRSGDLAGQGWYRLARIPLPARWEGEPKSEIDILQVDIRSAPLAWRKQTFKALAEIVAPLSGRQLIVAGDFNTPADSVWFKELRNSCRSAFQDAGDGFHATWPSWCPMLSLDQVWLSKSLEAYSCERGATHASDHLPVIVTVGDPRW